MSMPLRIAVKDGWYHVMARATSGRLLFEDARAHTHFLDLLGEAVEAYVKQGEEESMVSRFSHAVALGGERFFAGLKRRVRGNREQPARRFFADRPTWEAVFE